MMSFQKIYGLYGLEHHTVEINGDVTMRENRQTTEERATQLIKILNAEFSNTVFQKISLRVF